ncbi:MAG TPA: nucleotidyltransferase domain-containing protein [Verrucomicrobiales bacterium]|nr:nucleotidyltransferase domain-containing protein [Verrucomicrobiales bacterium]
MDALAELLSSRVKAEVFRLLFGVVTAPLHLRELARRSGLAVGTVRQELQRLSGLDLVRVQPDGNRTAYQAATDHPLFQEIHGMVLKTSGLVDVLRGALTSPEVSLAFVFGSMAAGNPAAQSDIDLFVIGTLTLRQLTARLTGLPEKLGREINPHILTPDEFRRRRKSKDHFVTTVLAGPRLFVKGGPDELKAMG